MRYAFLCLTIFAAQISCKKETLNVNSFWQCSQSQNFDSTGISSKLIGSWTWSKQACGDGAGKVKSANKNVKVTFRADGTFSVDESATIFTQGTWKLVQADSNSWSLNLSSTSNYLYGRILFCDNQVLFNSSYIDGCDNLFNKSD